MTQIPLNDLALAIAIGQRVVDAAGALPPAAYTPYQKVTAGWARLALEHARGLLWALQTSNKPVGMASLRAITDMLFALDAVNSDPKFQEYRCHLVLLEAPLRALDLVTSPHSPGAATHAALQPLYIQVVEGERDAIRAALAALPRHPKDPDRWRHFSIKRRATLADQEAAYAFLYEMASGYAHSDGYAMADVGRFSASDQQGMLDMGMLYFLALVEAVIEEHPAIEQNPEVVSLWNAWAARREGTGDP